MSESNGLDSCVAISPLESSTAEEKNNEKEADGDIETEDVSEEEYESLGNEQWQRDMDEMDNDNFYS